MNEHLKEKMEALCGEMQAEGYSVVMVAASYSAADTHFSTKLSLTAQPALGVTDDHIVLDAIREITSEWSAIVH